MERRADLDRDEQVDSELEFQNFYRTTYRQMVRLALLTTGSEPAAEEIVQDAFVSLYRSWSLVENPPAWLRSVVVNGCTSWVRRRSTERRHPLGPEPIVSEPEAMWVRDALKSLSPRQRAAIVLRYYEDLPELEIAAVLGCRPGTVKSLLSRALTQLSKEMNDV